MIQFTEDLGGARVRRVGGGVFVSRKSFAGPGVCDAWGRVLRRDFIFCETRSAQTLLGKLPRDGTVVSVHGAHQRRPAVTCTVLTHL